MCVCLYVFLNTVSFALLFYFFIYSGLISDIGLISERYNNVKQNRKTKDIFATV